MQFSIGDTIDRYKVVEKLGEGGMAVVYKAIHKTLDLPFAIKVLKTNDSG